MPRVIYRVSADNADYVILESCPVIKGKAKSYGRGYRHFRLMKVEKGVEPALGSERGRGVIEMVRDPGTCFFGEGVRSEGRALLEELKRQADTLI